MRGSTGMGRGLGVVVAILGVALSGAGWGQDGKTIDNPQYQAWSAFKVGSFVKQKTVMAGTGFNTEMFITQKLVEKTAEKLVLEMSQTMISNGQKMNMPAQKTEVKAKMPAPPKVETKKVDHETKEGKETLTIGGQKVECKWTQTTMTTNGQKVVSKVWMNDDFPGKSVQMNTEASGTKTSVTTVEFKALK